MESDGFMHLWYTLYEDPFIQHSNSFTYGAHLSLDGDDAMLSISLKDPTVRSVVHITYNIMGASVQILTSKCTAHKSQAE